MLDDRGTHVRSPNYWFHTSQVFSAAANSVYLWQQWRQRRQSDIYRSSQKVNETHPWWVSGELAVRSWEALSQSAPRRQRAVTAYLTSKQLPPCGLRVSTDPLTITCLGSLAIALTIIIRLPLSPHSGPCPEPDRIPGPQEGLADHSNAGQRSSGGLLLGQRRRPWSNHNPPRLAVGGIVGPDFGWSLCHCT